jgi:molybdenum cofactor cytidylyltransferase
MFLGEISTDKAGECTLLHPLFIKDTILEKGRILSQEDIALLQEAEVKKIFCARPDEGEISQDIACEIIANELIGENTYWTAPFNGQCKIYALKDGILNIERERVERFNFETEKVVLATAEPFSWVKENQLIAVLTVSPAFIAPFKIDEYIFKVSGLSSLMTVKEPKSTTISFLQTELPQSSSLKQKEFFEKIQAKVNLLGSNMASPVSCAHCVKEVESALYDFYNDMNDTLLIAGALPSTCFEDVIPLALTQTGAKIEVFNAPVYMGAHLIKASYNSKTIYILPEEERLVSFSSIDFLLQNILCQTQISEHLFLHKSTRGILTEETNRSFVGMEKHLHQEVRRRKNIGILVLAGGFSKRTLNTNKLLFSTESKSLVQHTLINALKSKAAVTYVLTGYQAEQIHQEIIPYDAREIFFPDFAQGVNASIRFGLSLFPKEIDGVLVLPADMPFFSTRAINKLIDSFSDDKICVPVCEKLRYNPVLWGRNFFKQACFLNEDPLLVQPIPQLEGNIQPVEFSKSSLFFDLNTIGDLSVFQKK